MSDNEAPPKVAVPHVCGGPSCYFCEWSNPTLDIPEVTPVTSSGIGA